MNRRNFIKRTTVAGAGITAFGWNPESEKTSPALFNYATDDNFELNEITISELSEGMASGKYTSRQLVELYLNRIETVDKAGVKLNAVIEVNTDAVSIADAMDKERAEGNIRGPLHGIPVLVKDNIDTGDKMMTTAGALALIGNYASADAFIIKQLRAAGAVILGKTNLSEWANFRSFHSVSGWSSRGHQTKNPYVLDRNPSGSSSGSAVAVAANLCAVAVGTETDGSIISPSSVNGIVGLKPTVGLLSRSGIIPISSTQDTAGPMGRHVEDVAILLSALASIDPLDPAASAAEGNISADYFSALNENALKGVRIGIEKSHLDTGNKSGLLFSEAVKLIKKAGAEIVEIAFLEAFNALGDAELTVLEYEFKSGVNKYLSKAEIKFSSLDDIIDYNEKNAAAAQPYFGQEILIVSNALGDLQSPEYISALETSVAAKGIIEKMMSENDLHALCGISSGPAWCIDPVNGDSGSGYSFTSPAAMAGFPHVTVPMGLVLGLPVGISFMSTAFKEQEILNYAFAFEQHSHRRTVPQFIPTIFPE